MLNKKGIKDSKYEVLELLGQGAYGEVYKVKMKSDGRVSIPAPLFDHHPYGCSNLFTSCLADPRHEES